VLHECHRFAGQCRRHAEALQPFVERYGEDADDEPARLHSDLFGGTRSGGLGLRRDLHDLDLMATECDISWTLVGQAAQGARDRGLANVGSGCEGEAAVSNDPCGLRLLPDALAAKMMEKRGIDRLTALVAAIDIVRRGGPGRSAACTAAWSTPFRCCRCSTSS
jgi:hypothetical protein